MSVVVVGRPARLLADAISEYERRAARYWSLDVHEVKAEKAGSNRTPADVRQAEAARLLDAVPPGLEIVALTREGESWSSPAYADYLGRLGLRSAPGAAFVIGGAFGLGEAVLERARHRLSLSAATLPHELARLVLAEQLYRAGTLARGEPYHKASR